MCCRVDVSAVRPVKERSCGNLPAGLLLVQGTETFDLEVRIQSSGLGFAQHQDLSTFTLVQNNFTNFPCQSTAGKRLHSAQGKVVRPGRGGQQ